MEDSVSTQSLFAEKLDNCKRFFEKEIAEWFEEIYLKIKPEDSEIYPGYNAEFALRKYDGSHPSVLDHHPWHQIEDVRKII